MKHTQYHKVKSGTSKFVTKQMGGKDLHESGIARRTESGIARLGSSKRTESGI